MNESWTNWMLNFILSLSCYEGMEWIFFPNVLFDRRDDLLQFSYDIITLSCGIPFRFQFWKPLSSVGNHFANISIRTIGWTSPTLSWRSLRLKFGPIVFYGGIDTTNLAERHWVWINYLLLMGKVNRSLQNLVVAIIGSARIRTRVGGPTLLDYFKLLRGISK